MKMDKFIRRRQGNAQEGMTLIELLVACAVLVFGLLGCAVLMTIAIANNGRSRVDSSATMLAQGVLEEINAAMPAGGTSISDCAGNAWSVNTGEGGAKLSQGAIDFTESSSGLTGYQMNYVICSGNARTAYDVRWNLQHIGASGTYLVTVGARPNGAANGNALLLSFPVNLREYVGPQW